MKFWYGAKMWKNRETHPAGVYLERFATKEARDAFVSQPRDDKIGYVFKPQSFNSYWVRKAYEENGWKGNYVNFYAGVWNPAKMAECKTEKVLKE